MGLLDHVVANAVRGTSRHAGYALGSVIGVAAGAVANEVAHEVAQNITADMRAQQEEKNLQLERRKMELEEEKKANNLPLHCPHCNAPTNKKIVCEYCNCRVIN